MLSNPYLQMSIKNLLRRPLFIGAVTVLFAFARVEAEINYPITFNDPGGANASYYAAITSNIQAAGAYWAEFLVGSGSIEVQVEFTTSIPGIDGASFTNGYVHTNGARNVYEQGAAYEIRTGIDPNGASPDVHIRINPNYLANTLWLDPHPTERTDPIPANRLDALSLFIHELAHAYAFSGWMNGTTGQLPPDYMSTFDENVYYDGANFFFVGPAAQADYGGPVPITYGNPTHLGNNSPRPGSDLLNDLMNGVVYYYQTRYTISRLDRAIVQDCGIAISIEPRALRVSSLARLANGHFLLQGVGIPARVHTVKATSDLSQAFTAIGTVTTDNNGNFQFEDLNTLSFSKRFYRVVYP
ncbi:MAG: hypothetical protein QOI22_1052 [Verrucomicrobiota bacterium]